MECDKKHTLVIKSEEHSSTITWVLDATQLGDIDNALWTIPNAKISKQNDTIVIIRNHEKLKITLKSKATTVADEHQIIVVGMVEGKKKYGILKRNEMTLWSDTEVNIPINQQDIENISKKTITHLDHINYIKVSNYNSGDYTGNAWYDVKRKRYLYTIDDDQKLIENAAILDANDDYSCFYSLHEEVTELQKVNLNPLFWITNVKNMHLVSSYYPILGMRDSRLLKFRFRLLSGMQGPIFNEEYFLTDNDKDPLISIGHVVAPTLDVTGKLVWFLSSVEHLDTRFYDELKFKKIKPGASNFNAFFYAELELLFIKYNKEWCFKGSAIQTIKPDSKVRLSFKDKKVIWYIQDKGIFLEGLIDKTSSRQMMPLWLDTIKESTLGYWMNDNTPVNSKENDTASLPELKLYYQKNNKGEGFFLDGLEGITGFSQEGEFLYVSTREGVIYLLDRYGKSFIYALDCKWFENAGTAAKLQTLLEGKKTMPFIKISGIFWQPTTENIKHELTILYNSEKSFFYLITKEEETKNSCHIITDLNDLVASCLVEKIVYLYKGFNAKKFDELSQIKKDGTIYFDNKANPFLERIILHNRTSLKLMKDSIFFSKDFFGDFSLALQSQEGAYIYTILSIHTKYNAIGSFNKLDNIKKYLTSIDDVISITSKVIIPELLPITQSRGWLHTVEKKGFIFGYSTRPIYTALFLGLDDSKDFLYACIDNKKVVRIQKQFLGSMKDMIIEADFICPVNNQLLIQPLQDKSVSIEELMKISYIDHVRMIILQPSAAGQVIQSDDWSDVDIAVSIPTERSSEAEEIVIKFTRKFTDGSYIQRVGNNLWIREYGKQYGLCLFDCFEGEIDFFKEKSQCQFISESNPNNKINQKKVIENYSSISNVGDNLLYPKESLKSFFEDKFVWINSPSIEENITEYNFVDVNVFAKGIVSTNFHGRETVNAKLKKINLSYRLEGYDREQTIADLLLDHAEYSHICTTPFPAGAITLFARSEDDQDRSTSSECNFTLAYPPGMFFLFIHPKDGDVFIAGEKVEVKVGVQSKKDAYRYRTVLIIDDQEVDFRAEYIGSDFTLMTYTWIMPTPMRKISCFARVENIDSGTSVSSNIIYFYPKEIILQTMPNNTW